MELIDYILKASFVAGIFISGGLISSFLISFFSPHFRYIYGLNKSGLEDEDDEDEDEDDNYEYKYIEEFNEIEDKEIDKAILKELNNIYITEETPKGLVHMSYNYEKEGFNYFCKNKSIPYKYLETVGRKYCIIYLSKHYFIDFKQELIKGIENYNNTILQQEEEQKRKKEEEEEEEKRRKEEEEENDKDKKDKEKVKVKRPLFASFKNYNSPDKNVNQKKNYILTEKTNMYFYKGNLDDFELILNNDYIKIDKKNIIDEENENKIKRQKIEEINYSNFKNKNL